MEPYVQKGTIGNSVVSDTSFQGYMRACPLADSACSNVGEHKQYLRPLIRIIQCLVFVMPLVIHSGVAQASVLANFEPVFLQPGERLDHIVQWQAPDGFRVQIKLGIAPDNASIGVSDEGQLVLSWQSGPDLAPETLIQLKVDNIDTGEVLETRSLLIRRADTAEPEKLAALPAPASPEQADVKQPLNTPPPFGPFEEQSLLVGQPWQLLLLADDPTSTGIQVLASELPANAVMTYTVGDGYHLSWTPEESQTGNFLVTLRARHTDHPQLVTDAALILNVNGSEPVDPDVPVMKPMANQVVSPGRVLTFKVRANIADGSIPWLLVDRLPLQASFDVNPDDSRTFYWQTTSGDQGEHLFRFTAIHPNDPDLRTSQNVLMVIGDPSRSRTLPDQQTLTELPLATSE